MSATTSFSQPGCSLILSQIWLASSWYSVVPHRWILPPSSFQLPFFTPSCCDSPSTSAYLSASAMMHLLNGPFDSTSPQCAARDGRRPQIHVSDGLEARRAQVPR